MVDSRPLLEVAFVGTTFLACNQLRVLFFHKASFAFVSKTEPTAAFSGGPNSLEARAAAAGRKAVSERPRNVAVTAGETVVLRCVVDRPPPATRVMWVEYASQALGSAISDNDVVLAHPNRDRYRIVDETSTAFHLEIRDVQLNDGGQYGCMDLLDGPPNTYRGQAELIVIGLSSLVASVCSIL